MTRVDMQRDTALRHDAVLRVFFKEAQYELIKLMRERAYVFSVIGLPIVFFLVFGIAHPSQIVQGQQVSRYLLASCSAFGAMGAALFAIGVGLVTERSHGWLELKRASPMPTYSYLTAKVIAALAFGELITFSLVTLGVVTAGMRVSGIEILRLAMAIAWGGAAFSAIGVFLGLILAPGSAVGMVNLVYLPLSLGGGLWVPLDMLPKWLQSTAPFLPSYQLSRLTLHALGYPIGVAWPAWGLLFAYGAVFALLSVWLFRRQELAC